MKTTLVFLCQKYGKFWSISVKLFVKHKPSNCEERSWKKFFLYSSQFLHIHRYFQNGARGRYRETLKNHWKIKAMNKMIIFCWNPFLGSILVTRLDSITMQYWCCIRDGIKPKQSVSNVLHPTSSAFFKACKLRLLWRCI